MNDFSELCEKGIQEFKIERKSLQGQIMEITK